MKRILVPIDFSENAYAPLLFALMQASKMNSEVIAFHVSHLPVLAPDISLDSISAFIEAEKREKKRLLNELVDKALTHTKLDDDAIPIEKILSTGLAVDEILSIAQERACDLIIMGTKGASGLKKIFWGSNTMSLLKRSKIPVLAVPETYTLRALDTVVLATDFDGIASKEIMQPLLELSTCNNAKIIVYNARTKEELPTYDEAVNGLNLENKIREIDHTYHFDFSVDVISGINNYLGSADADLLVMVHKNKTFFESLFSVSFTNEMLATPMLPLLIIPELI